MYFMASPAAIAIDFRQENLSAARASATAFPRKCIKEQERDEFAALEEAIPDLKRLDRYERRAWSQQKHAIREFMNIKLLRRLDAAGQQSICEPAAS